MKTLFQIKYSMYSPFLNYYFFTAPWWNWRHWFRSLIELVLYILHPCKYAKGDIVHNLVSRFLLQLEDDKTLKQDFDQTETINRQQRCCDLLPSFSDGKDKLILSICGIHTHHKFYFLISQLYPIIHLPRYNISNVQGSMQTQRSVQLG